MKADPMKEESLRRAEAMVRKLSNLLQPIEDAFYRQIPDGEMRAAYRVLRELKSTSTITPAQFDQIYGLFDALSDSMTEPAKQDKAADDCLKCIRALPDSAQKTLLPDVNRVVSKLN